MALKSFCALIGMYAALGQFVRIGLVMQLPEVRNLVTVPRRTLAER